MIDPTSYAVRAVMRTLRDRLPAQLVALDAERRAEVVCTPGPYVFPTDATLIVNGHTATIPAGEYAASMVGVGLDIPGIIVSERRGGGRAVIAAPGAPTIDQPSRVEIGHGTANGVLGITPSDSQTLLALADPTPVFLERGLFAGDVDVVQPVIAVDRDPMRAGATYTTGERIVSVRLDVYVPGPVGGRHETLEAIRAFAGAIDHVIVTGDERGPYLVGGEEYGAAVGVCRPRSLQVEPTVRAFGSRSSPTPIGRALIDYDVQLWT